MSKPSREQDQDEGHRERKPEEHHLRPYRITTHKRLLGASQKASQEALAARDGKLTQARKDALAASEAITGTLFANLTHLLILGEVQPTLITPLAKPNTAASRYQRQGLRMLPQVLEGLDREGWLKLNKAGHIRGIASTVNIGPKLEAALSGMKLTLADFKIMEAEETIILVLSQWKLGRDEDGEISPSKTKHWQPYEDNSKTIAYRKQLKRLNAWLAKADIQLARPLPLVDIHARRLRRHFSLPREVELRDSFKWNRGGRLFGGFWENMDKTNRKHLRLAGEPIADLDFKSMFVRLALARTGIDLPPDFDPYDIPGLERDVAKKLINTLLNTKGNKLPNDLKAALPGWNLKKGKTAVAARVPQLAPLLGTGIGLSLMFTESRILLGVLEVLRRRGVLALPMHDGLMVPESRADEVMQVMREQSSLITGRELPVERKA